MNITILSFGSRGDLQPFVALAHALIDEKHDVTIAGAHEYRAFIERQGLTFTSIGVTISDLIKKSINRQYGPKKKKLPIYTKKEIQEITEEYYTWLDNSYKACAGSDLIIFSGLSLSYSKHIADALKVPIIRAHLSPMVQSNYYTCPGFPDIPLGKAYNRFTFKAMEHIIWGASGKGVNKWRKEYNLSPITAKEYFDYMHKAQIPTICAFSPSIFPKPKDWGQHIEITGYWFHDEERIWKPRQDLLNFLDAGEKPVYIGFGSMHSGKNDSTREMILEALRQTKSRAILAGGWDDYEEVKKTKDYFVINEAPHNWLFPKMKAVVHHGGAGTTAAGLRAGTPAVIVPLIADQPFWSKKANNLGAAVKPLPFGKLNVKRLSKRLQEISASARILETTTDISKKIQEENGIQNALNFIKQVINKNR